MGEYSVDGGEGELVCRDGEPQLGECLRRTERDGDNRFSAQINRRSSECGGVPVDTLVAGIEGEGKRSFVITRAKPDGKSYARDIADRYGLSFDGIMNGIKSRKGGQDPQKVNNEHCYRN